MFFKKRRARRKARKTPVTNPFEFGFVAGVGVGNDFTGVHWLPLEFLERLVPPGLYGNMIRLEKDHMAEIEDSLRENGWTETLTICIDDQKVCLQDGHHRVVIAGRLGYPDAPVGIRYSRGIRKHNLPLRELVDLIW